MRGDGALMGKSFKLHLRSAQIRSISRDLHVLLYTSI